MAWKMQVRHRTLQGGHGKVQVRLIKCRYGWEMAGRAQKTAGKAQETSGEAWKGQVCWETAGVEDNCSENA